MQADVVDLDTLESGSQRTGLYFAIWGMVTKLALAGAVGIAFPLLDVAGFADGAINAGFALFHPGGPLFPRAGDLQGGLDRTDPRVSDNGPERQRDIRRQIEERGGARPQEGTVST